MLYVSFLFSGQKNANFQFFARKGTKLGRENAVSDFLRKNFKTFVSTKEFLNKNYFEFQNQIMFCSLTNFWPKCTVL